MAKTEGRRRTPVKYASLSFGISRGRGRKVEVSSQMTEDRPCKTSEKIPSRPFASLTRGTEISEKSSGMNVRAKSQQRWDHNAKALGLVGVKN